MSAYRSGEPCPACKSGSTTSEGECLDCGAVWGNAFLCPHCGKHAKTVADRLVGTVCKECKEARVAAALPKEAYGPLLGMVRFYRRWPARATFYVPFAAVVFALAAAATSHYVKTSARAARHDYIAEYGPGVRPPSTPLADLAPEAPLAFVGALLIGGLVGLALYLGVAMVLRQRVHDEAARLARPSAIRSARSAP